MFPRVFLATVLAFYIAGSPKQLRGADLQTWSSIPFLDLFTQNETPAPAGQAIQLDIDGRRMAAYLARPIGPGRLPAVLLVPGREGFTETLQRFAREMAGIGYVVLAVDYREAPDAGGSALLRQVVAPPRELTGAVEWLAAQSMVDPDRIGALAWNDAFDPVTRLAETGKVTAAYPRRLVSQAGMTEQAWVEVYEFLGMRLEDRPPTPSSAKPDAQFARIVDIMRVINSDQGVRGRLARALEMPPAGAAEWEQARSEAAVLAEAGNLLLARRPPRGSLVGWQQRAGDFRGAARTLLQAVEARDFAASQQSLREMAQTCAACHADHR